MKNLLYVLAVFFLMTSAVPKPQTIYLEVTNLKNNKGYILVCIFEDNETFKKEEEGTFEWKKFPKTSMKNGKMLVKFTLEPGTYGLTLVDDVNGNNDMDYNFFGLPKEGFGFSNYYHSGMTKPHFDKFSFKVANQEVRLQTKMRYL